MLLDGRCFSLSSFLFFLSSQLFAHAHLPSSYRSTEIFFDRDLRHKPFRHLYWWYCSFVEVITRTTALFSWIRMEKLLQFFLVWSSSNESNKKKSRGGHVIILFKTVGHHLKIYSKVRLLRLSNKAGHSKTY